MARPGMTDVTTDDRRRLALPTHNLPRARQRLLLSARLPYRPPSQRAQKCPPNGEPREQSKAPRRVESASRQGTHQPTPAADSRHARRVSTVIRSPRPEHLGRIELHDNMAHPDLHGRDHADDRLLARTSAPKPQEIQPGHRDSVMGGLAGAEEDKAELREVVEFMRDPKRFKKLGARLPKGLLAARPYPAPGKTCSRRPWQRGQARFYAQSASSLFEMFAGIRRRGMRPGVPRGPKELPFDHLHRRADAVGATAAATSPARKDQTIIPAPGRMDGFKGNEDLVVSRPRTSDQVDPALLRPGASTARFRLAPRHHGREEILRVHLRTVRSTRYDSSSVARQTSGLPPAPTSPTSAPRPPSSQARHNREVVPDAGLRGRPRARGGRHGVGRVSTITRGGSGLAEAGHATLLR